MKLIKILITVVFVSTFAASAQKKCLNQVHLKNLDASWERAQLELDHDFLNSLLADDFIWVHNHANTIDSKLTVLERVKRHLRDNNKTTKSRISSDVKVIISGATGIVTGYTIVDRGPTPTTYHFMRTYAEVNGTCLLVANHTMAIPENTK